MLLSKSWPKKKVRDKEEISVPVGNHAAINVGRPNPNSGFTRAWARNPAGPSIFVLTLQHQAKGKVDVERDEIYIDFPLNSGGDIAH